MFGGIVRLIRGSLDVRYQIRFFEHQVKDLVSCCPRTKQDREPADDEHMRRHSKFHTR